MAISAGMVYQAQNGGSDTACSGGFRGGANLAAPAAPTVTATAGGSVSAATYYVVITVIDGNGESEKSAERSVVTAGGNLTITVTDPTAANQGYLVYVATASGGPYWQNSATVTAHGTNAAITATPPTSGTQAPGTDRSKQTGLQVNVDNATITATTAGANSNVITFTGYVPTAADVGNTFLSTAGTNINVGLYEITAWTATTWTVTGAQNLTTAGGAGSAITGVMGGAFATPGRAAQFVTAGNGLFINYNAASFGASASTNVAAGSLSTGNFSFIVGYDTTRDIGNTDANRPTIAASANSVTILNLSRANALVANLILDGTGRTSTTGLVMGGGNGTIRNCKALTAANIGFLPSAQTTFLFCEATGCGDGFKTQAAGCVYIGCTANSNTGSNGGWNATSFYICINCVSRSNTATGYVGNTSGYYSQDCVAYGNGTSGFDMSGGGCFLANCISYGNTGVGFRQNVAAASVTSIYLANCAGGGNSANFSAAGGSVFVALARIASFVTLTGNPFTSAAGGDFSLNSTAGAGAACKAAGIPGSTASTQLPGLSSLAYPDIGAVQSTVAASTSPVGQITGARSIGTY